MMVTQQEARDMWDAIQQFQTADGLQAQIDRDAKIAVAQTWWDGIKPATPTTRAEALSAHGFVKTTLDAEIILFKNEVEPVQKEIHQFRVVLLRKKLELANEKFKELKAN